MIRPKARLIQRVPELAGLWQFTTPAGDHVGIVADGRHGAVLCLFTLASGRWTMTSVAHLEEMVNASDAYLVGPDLYFCGEKNSWHSLDVGKWSVADLLGGKRAPLAHLRYALRRWGIPDFLGPNPPLTRIGHMELSDAQAKKVALPLGASWAVASGLRPDEWLFDPKWVRGAALPLVAADTADGQAMLFPIHDGSVGAHFRNLSTTVLGVQAPRERPSAFEGEGFAIRDALGPQALAFQARRLVVFKHVAETPYPFWLRHDDFHYDRAMSTPGDLTVQEGLDAPRNLSAQLKIGPITSFSLTRDCTPWVFAVRAASAGSEVLAIARQGSSWVVKDRRSIRSLIHELTVWRRDGAWQLVYAVKEDEEESSVWHLPWTTAGG